ncbi:hypothetical protein [Kineosporia succinea]|uniref:Zinc finger protein n=1 Tax=Kineosporia succinea TaxID=84632 RepID=A0ABT9PEH9_9ACTN|nr:hypothetical protein [Kineosporia succinea]MDP9831102.1 hypothetical protein [Kineosporia succinea]
MNTPHPDATLIDRYTTGDPTLDDVSVWSLEAHLESCEQCRAQQVSVFRTTGDDILQRVAAALDEGIATGPGPQPVPRLAARRRWAVWSLMPWLAMTFGILAAALGLGAFAPEHPSPVLLLAPVLPLLPVAGSWTRYSDPAWELLGTSPRTGLWMLLRRSVAALLLVIPVLLAASWIVGLAPALWLLPCLALTLTTLALSDRFGVVRSALSVWALWTAGVLVPGVVTAEVPTVLTASATPVWAAATVIAAATVAVRARGFARL